MSNSFGRLFKITTFGESHGPMIGVVIDGCPAGVEITEGDVALALKARRPGASPASTARREADIPSIVSGVYKGKTTGAPITILIENKDVRSGDYDAITDVFRPGHADLSYHVKYGGYNDPRGGGRASARETACRVAAGAVAAAFLKLYQIDLFAYVISVGDIKAQSFDRDLIKQNPFRCADPLMAERLHSYLSELAKEGDSTGGLVELRIAGAPAGLGEPLFDKLSARLAYAIMGLPAVKGVEIGTGFAAAFAKGSENNDQTAGGRFLSNNAGGVLGGISTGEEITVRAAVKPVPSIAKTQSAFTKTGENVDINIKGRHDICVAPRLAPVMEAMAWLVLADFVMLKNASELIY